MPTQPETNAALYGTAPMTPEIRDHVENIDAALAANPFDEVVTVRAVVPDEALPYNLSPGMVLTQPTFLDVEIGVTEPALEEGHSRLVIQVLPGTPALHLGADRYLIGRGIGYRVDRIENSEDARTVFGTMIGIISTI